MNKKTLLAAASGTLAALLLTGCVPLNSTERATGPINTSAAPQATTAPNGGAAQSENKTAPQHTAQSDPAPAQQQLDPRYAAATLQHAEAALATVREQFQNAVVLDLDFESDTQTWQAEIAAHHSTVQLQLNADGTQVLFQEHPEAIDNSDLHEIQQLRVPLSDALRAIPAELQGQLLDAHLDSYGPQLVWELSVLPATQHASTKLLVDAVTGALVR